MANQNQKANDIIKSSVLWAAGAGIIPIPVADIFAVTMVQLDMLRQLCATYGADYSELSGRSLISAIGASTFARYGASLLKSIPGVGSVIGGVSMSIMSGASTYAMGQVFAYSLATYGNIDDINLADAKKMYKEKFEEGKEFTKRVKVEAEQEEAHQEAVDQEDEDVFVRLEKLAQLREKGLISEEDFEKKKQELIDLI